MIAGNLVLKAVPGPFYLLLTQRSGFGMRQSTQGVESNGRSLGPSGFVLKGDSCRPHHPLFLFPGYEVNVSYSLCSCMVVQKKMVPQKEWYY